MSYDYLKDGTKFSAEEINDRTEAAAESVNSLDSNALAFGALRHEHLPQLIGPSGFAEGGFTKFVSNKHLPFDGNSFAQAAYEGKRYLPVNVTYPTPISFEDRDIDAFIVLFNANVRSFQEFKDGSYYALNPERNQKNEDFLSVRFTIRVDVEWDDSPFGPGSNLSLELPHTVRAVSPGFTFFGIDNAGAGTVNRKPGSSFWNDTMSFRDAAIRTIIRPKDIVQHVYGDTEDLSLISKIRVRGFGVVVEPKVIHSGPNQVMTGTAGVFVTKSNLTVIPVQAKLVSVGE